MFAAELSPETWLMAVPNKDSTTAATIIIMTATITITIATRTWVKPLGLWSSSLTLFIVFMLITELKVGFLVFKWIP